MLTPGTVLQNRYRVVGPIGQGGMGAVYEALHQQLKSRVALKQMTVAGTQLSRAFEREAQLLASLRHPALPQVIDHFTEPHGQFLVMEFIEGRDLGEMLTNRGSAFPVDQVLSWADQLLDALDYLHTQQTPIIHRDIKPPNLKLTRRGEIILLDFGLAKGSTALQTHAATAHSVMGYTPQYASLEQIQGSGTNERGDLFSLATTLYYLATNQQPVDALTRASAVIQGDPDPLIPPSQLNSQIPQGLADGLTQALALNPKQRPASAAEMRQMVGAKAVMGQGNGAMGIQILPVGSHQQSGVNTSSTIAVNQPVSFSNNPPMKTNLPHILGTVGGFIWILASISKAFFNFYLGSLSDWEIYYFIPIIIFFPYLIFINPYIRNRNYKIFLLIHILIFTLIIITLYLYAYIYYSYIIVNNKNILYHLLISLSTLILSFGILFKVTQNISSLKRYLFCILVTLFTTLNTISHYLSGGRGSDKIYILSIYSSLIGSLLVLGSSIALLRRKPIAP